jgi:hypothetical protein
MNSTSTKPFLFLTVAVPLVVLFQNCGAGFEVDTKQIANRDLGSAGSGPEPTGGTSPSDSTPTGPAVDATALGIRFFDSAQTLISSGVALTAGQEYTLFASGYSATQTLTWSLQANTAGCSLTTLTATPFTTTLRCSTTGSTSIQLNAKNIDGTSKLALLQHTMGPSTPDYCSPLVGAKPAAVFRIPAGTASGAWNLATSPVSVAVGQTLRICNDDAGNHQLKTSGTPCATQPTAMAQGQFYDCLVTSTATNGLSDALTGGSFSVAAFDGRALFATNCANCHGAFPGQNGMNATGASGSSIDTLIKGNRGGMGAIKLTPEQLNAIGYALSY